MFGVSAADTSADEGAGVEQIGAGEAYERLAGVHFKGAVGQRRILLLCDGDALRPSPGDGFLPRSAGEEERED